MSEYTRPVGERGQVTFPKEVRENMELEKGDKVAFIEVEPGTYLIKKVDSKKLREFLLVDHKSEYIIKGNN